MTNKTNKLSHKEIRNSFVSQLLQEKNKDTRNEILKNIKNSKEYKKAEKNHIEEREILKDGKENIKEIISKEKSRKDSLCFTNLYSYLLEKRDRIKKKNIDINNMDDNETCIQEIKIFQEKLQGKDLVDLGCGGPASTRYMYELAGMSKARNYIGIDQHPESEEELYNRENNDVKYQNIFKRNIEYFKKEHKNEEIHTTGNVYKGDMLEFLTKRTTTSNFTINGIDITIIQTQKYADELIKNIDRLTLPGNIVFGINCDLLRLLERNYNFKKVYPLNDYSLGTQIYEKIS